MNKKIVKQISKDYLLEPSSVKEDIPHPSINFLSDQDLDYLITYLLSLGSTDEWTPK